MKRVFEKKEGRSSERVKRQTREIDLQKLSENYADIITLSMVVE